MKVPLKLLLFFCSFNSVAQLTLSDCHEKARANYPLIHKFELIEKTRDYNVSNASKSYLPRFDISLLAGVIDGLPSISLLGGESTGAEFHLISILQLNQTLWDGGITRAQKEIAIRQSEVDLAQNNVAMYALEERVNSMYFGILLIDEQIDQLAILRENITRNRQRVQLAIENGTAFNSDVDEITVELLNLDQRETELIFGRQAYLTMLSLMIGEPLSIETDLEMPPANTSIVNPSDSSLFNRPEISLFHSQRALFEAQQLMNRTALYPKIGLTGFGTFITPGVDFATSSIDRILVGGISVSWNIGGLYRNNNNQALADLNIQQVANAEETFRFNNSLEQAGLRIKMNKYDALLEKDREIVSLKERIRHASELKYENGISTMSEVLDKSSDENLARQIQATHEIQRLNALYDYIINQGINY